MSDLPRIPRDWPVSINRDSGLAFRQSFQAQDRLGLFANANPNSIACQRMMPQVGRLLVRATWPHMSVEGAESGVRFDDGMQVPVMRLDRRDSLQTQVVVRTHLGDGRVSARIREMGETSPSLSGQWPFVENQDFVTRGACFVEDARSGAVVIKDAARDGLPALVEPTQAIVRNVLGVVTS